MNVAYGVISCLYKQPSSRPQKRNPPDFFIFILSLISVLFLKNIFAHYVRCCDFLEAIIVCVHLQTRTTTTTVIPALSRAFNFGTA